MHTSLSSQVESIEMQIHYRFKEKTAPLSI